MRPAAEPPVKPMCATAGMRDQRLADLRAEAGDDVDDAVRKARLGEQLRELEHRRRRELRRLDHRRAAGGERRRELPARQRQRRVPRRDDRDDALRLVARVGEHALLVGRDDGALHLVGEARVVAEVVAHVADLGDDFGGELAVVALLDLGQARRVGDDEIAEPPQHAAALGRRQRRPGAGSRTRAARRRPRPRHRPRCRARSRPRPCRCTGSRSAGTRRTTAQRAAPSM